MSFRGYMLLAVGLVLSGALFSQAQKDREKKTPVDIKAEIANRYPELDENAIVLTGEVVFHHNGAVISCDSAIRYSDKRIDCYRNVIINKDSTFAYGDRAEYNGEINLARVYSPVVKVIDGTATLYTYNFTFNTLTNVGIYYGGGVMYQDGNVMESERGYYYSDDREIVAVRNVEMKDDEYTMNGDSVRYNMDTKIAHFYTKSYIWTNDGEILTADRGRYNTQDSTYFFYGNSYVLTDVRETWADTIDYMAKRQDALLYGNIQINDEENASAGFGDFGQYWGERGETMLTKRPALLNYSEEHNNNDTIYMRADTIFMYVLYPSDGRIRDTVPAPVDPHAHLKWADTLPDSVRLAIADSLSPVIQAMRGEIGRLRRTSDSIMNVLYPPPPAPTAPPAAPVPADRLSPETEQPVSDSIPQTDEVIPAGTPEDNVTEDAPEERRRRRRNRGPNPGFVFYTDTVMAPPIALPDAVPMVLSPDSLAALAATLPPMSMATDSLSAMDKVRELLPDSLSRRGNQALLEMLDGAVPEGMAHLVSDSIDVAALRSVIGTANEPAPKPSPAPEPEPERYIPPEVRKMLERIETLTAEADSLQTAETYIRPKPPVIPADPVAVDSLAMTAVADSLALMDSLNLADSLAGLDKKALKRYQKEEKLRLKAELKAEKQRQKEMKQAAKLAEKQAKTIAQEAERRSRLVQKGLLPNDTIPPAGRLSRTDSLKLADSLAGLDKKALRLYNKAENKRLLEEKRRAERIADMVAKETERRNRLIERGMLPRDPVSTGLLDSVAVTDSLARLDSLPPPPEPEEQADTVERIFRGWRDVRIWRKDMQAVCDSIVGFSRDSTVRMYIDPILWHGDSQIVSDSLTLFTNGEYIDRAEFYGNPIMSSQLGDKQFNQVTGRTMTSLFRDNEVYRHDVFGNAEAFYYVQEEDDPEAVAFIVATSSNMTFLLEEQFVRYIIARENVEWPVYPIEQIPTNQPVELQGFKWLRERKPELRDVFDREIRPSERKFHESLETPKFPIAAKINRRREYLIENRLWADRVDPLPAHAVEYVASLQNEQ